MSEVGVVAKLTEDCRGNAAPCDRSCVKLYRGTVARDPEDRLRHETVALPDMIGLPGYFGNERATIAETIGAKHNIAKDKASGGR